MAKEHVTKCSKDNHVHVVHDEKAWYSLDMSLCPEYLLRYICIAGHVKCLLMIFYKGKHFATIWHAMYTPWSMCVVLHVPSSHSMARALVL